MGCCKIIKMEKNLLLEQRCPFGFSVAPRGVTQDYTDANGNKWKIIKLGRKYCRKKISSSTTTTTTINITTTTTTAPPVTTTTTTINNSSPSDIAREYWEKVTNADLLKKLKDAGKKVWKEGGIWYRDTRDRLSNWWEDFTTVPEWTKDYPCLKDIGNFDRSDSDDKVQVKTPSGRDFLYFYKNKNFVYEDYDKNILNGKWKCVSGKLYIKTEDGWEWTKEFKWDNTGKSKLGSLSSSSTSDGKIYTTPGDPYKYRLSDDCEWETKGKSITNWKSLINYPDAIKELDLRFPNAKEECSQLNNTSTITEPNKPSWVNEYSCFQGFVNMIPTTQTNKISFKSTSGKDSLNFYKNLKFIYEFENGSIINGTWKCDNNEMVIDTEDGSRYTSSKGWTKITPIKIDDLNPNIDDDNEL